MVNRKIYIPIWLDLLFKKDYTKIADDSNLHSNMVRFIIYLLPIPLDIVR